MPKSGWPSMNLGITRKDLRVLGVLAILAGVLFAGMRVWVRLFPPGLNDVRITQFHK